MKTFLIIVAVILVLILGLGFVFRDSVQMAMFFFALKPDVTFAEDTRHTPPDYANPDHWAALPEKEDDADVTPGGLDVDHQASAAVDVFFIHPTTYYKSDHWLQPLEDADANKILDEGVLRNQASVFSSCCKIYAPRYRQATLFSFMDDSGDGQKAIDFAYQDVKAAFQYFLENKSQGRPFIIAGHSQGGLHADTLLKDMIAGTELEDRLVAAYPVGYFIDGEGSVPVCESASQTGCQVTWNAVAPDAPSFQDTSASICVNPLNWSAAGERADFEANLGAVSFAADGEVEPGATDAQCVDGRLHVTEVRSPNYAGEMFGPGNYHIYDFSFYHMNIRENAKLRVASFVSAQEAAQDSQLGSGGL